MEKKKKKLVTKKPVKKSAKIKTKAKVLRRKKNVEQNSEVIFDSKIGDTDALFVSEPEPDINEALKEIDDLQKYETTINNSDNVDKKEIVEKQKKVFSWRKFFSLNNRLFSILIGLVFAGVFITGTYVFAVVPLGQLEPGCAPGAAGCTVSTPLADSFTGNFSGSGDLTTTGSFHVKANNTYQYFGSADQAKIYYNGSNLVLDVGSGAKVLTLGDASQSSYKLNFNTGSGGTPSNPGTIIYTGGATKTFDFGNNAGNKILTTGLSIENSDGAVVYTLPITDGSGDQVLKTNGSGILSWATVSGGVDWTNASSNLLTTGKGSFGNTSVRGAFLNDGTYSIRSYGTVALSKPSLAPLLYFLDSTYTINAEGVSHFFNGIGKSVDLNDATYAVNATGNSLFTGNITVTGKGTFGDATLATKGVTLYDSLYAINAFGPNYLTNDTLNATLHVVSTGVGGSSDVLIGDGNLGYAINAVGGILFPTVYATTGLSGSNVKITSDGKLFRDSSSLRYKHDIEPLLGDFSLILQTQAKQFLYNGSDEQSIGYIAEDFDALGLKDLVTYDDQNRPDGINYDRIPVYTLEVVKQQQKDIDALKIAAGLSDAGVVGSGSLSSVSTNSLLSGLSSILSDAGITINGAITYIKNISTDKLTAKVVRIDKMEMVDSSTGKIYCTWLSNGQLLRAEGTCDLVNVKTAFVQDSPKVLQPALNKDEIVKEVTGQIASQATPEVVNQAIPKVIEQATPKVIEQANLQVNPQVEENSAPAIPPQPSAISNLIQQATSSLINGVGDFLNWLFVTPLSKLSTLSVVQEAKASITENSAVLKSGLPSGNVKLLSASLLESVKSILK